MRGESFPSANRLDVPVATALVDPVREADDVRLRVEDGDGQLTRAEDLPDPIADRVDDRLEVELPRERCADLVDDGELGVSLLGLTEQALGLVEQSGVLQRDAEAPGQRREQADLGVAERVLAIHVLERDHPGPDAAGDQRHEERTLRNLAGDDDRVAVARSDLRHVTGQRERLARLEDVLPEADDPDGIVVGADAHLDRVHEADEAGIAIDHRDVDRLRIEDLADLVADEVVHRLHVELRDEALLDAVDDRELGRALLRLARGGRSSARRAGRSRGRRPCSRRRSRRVARRPR